jgi:hypothetical protein
MWPKFDEFKRGMEKWLKTNHPSYLKELGDQKWPNDFSGKHHSSVIIIKQLK